METTSLPTRKTSVVSVGTIAIGGSSPIAIQSMCATKTTDVAATLRQVRLLEDAGAELIRIAVDSKQDVEALREIRKETSANLVVDLQENYRLAKLIAPLVQKFRYNPGHLHHHQREVAVEEKVKFLVDVAGEHNCAIRIGVNFGSLDPALKQQNDNPRQSAVQSALWHTDLIQSFGFRRVIVSLKSSDPYAVIEVNKAFSAARPQIPLHLGVTEAGMLPEAEIKTRIAFEQLLPLGIGDTVRVSLTLPDDEKNQEVIVASNILRDIEEGRFRSFPTVLPPGMNVISCPSCSRVENKAFVQLAQKVKEVTAYAKAHAITIAVMGCRVNGPGETDEADIGLWCGPHFVNLKRGKELIGAFPYDEVISHLLSEVDSLIQRQANSIE